MNRVICIERVVGRLNVEEECISVEDFSDLSVSEVDNLNANAEMMYI